MTDTPAPATCRRIEVLLVEDHPGDVRLVRESFQDAKLTNPVHVAEDGAEALDFAHRRGEHADAPRPHVVLLNLNLPTMSAEEVLAELREVPELRRVPVFGLTASEAEEDLLDSNGLDVDAFLSKPVDPDEFVDLVRSIEGYWLTVVQVPSHGTDEAT